MSDMTLTGFVALLLVCRSEDSAAASPRFADRTHPSEWGQDPKPASLYRIDLNCSPAGTWATTFLHNKVVPPMCNLTSDDGIPFSMCLQSIGF